MYKKKANARVYVMIGNPPVENLSFTINDLVPLKQKKRYDFKDLTLLINCTFYKLHQLEGFVEDYDWLYQQPENQAIGFFTIGNTGHVFIPGSTLFPTILKPEDI